MTQDYEERLYASYLADHLTPRKGGAPPQAFHDSALRWERTRRQNLLVVARPASLPPER